MSDPSPLLVLQIGCDPCAGVYIAEGDLADTLRAMPAHTALMAGGSPPTADERAEFLAEAGQAARAAGWEMTPGGGWRCARCRERYGDTGEPRRFTIREVAGRRWGAP